MRHCSLKNSIEIMSEKAEVNQNLQLKVPPILFIKRSFKILIVVSFV
jgi:hypothetical protein